MLMFYFIEVFDSTSKIFIKKLKGEMVGTINIEELMIEQFLTY